MSRKFREFVSHRDGAIHHSGDVSDLLQRIAREHGSRLRQIIKQAVTNGEVDDDVGLREDLKELIQVLGSSTPDDQYPVRNNKNPRGEQDVVTRPKADGGGSPAGPGGGGGGGGEGGD